LYEKLGLYNELFKYFTTLVGSYNFAWLATAASQANHQAAMPQVIYPVSQHSSHTPASRSALPPVGILTLSS